MRLFSKILSIILVLFVLSILFVPPVKAGCHFDSYHRCTGTCSCQCGGSCKCVKVAIYCVPSGCNNTNCCKYNCRKYSCNSNEDRVSGSCAGTDMVCCKPKPQPTPTKGSGASPTVTKAPTPTTGGMQCSTTAQCYNAYCAPTTPQLLNAPPSASKAIVTPPI